MTDDFWTDADVISTYSRAEALADGVLVDVSEMAREAGFRFPVAITAGVHALLSNIPEKSGEDYDGRLWDVLWMASLAAKRGRRSGPGDFRGDCQPAGSATGQPASCGALLVYDRSGRYVGPGDYYLSRR